jgi:glycosyltransferase involved in cell wall biosynthesis
MNDKKLTISVIIPAFNCEATIADCLNAFQYSTLLPDEIIVIDDGSTDRTLKIVREYAVTAICFPINKGRVAARKAGFVQAVGDIIVSIDSDVVIQSDTIATIAMHFEQHPECMAVTGRLSDRSYHKNFSSIYKHNYMHYRFSNLPRDVHFLFGSIFAVRREVKPENIPLSREIGEDTEMGLYLSRQGIKIHLLKQMTVDHHKRYSLLTLLKNDFIVPYMWVPLFCRYAGSPKGLCKRGPVFAHVSIYQTLMIAFTGIITIMVAGVAVNILPKSVLPSAFIVLVAWYFLNHRFFSLLSRNMPKYLYPAIVIFTYIDTLAMLAGIIFGFLRNLINPQKREKAY